MKRLLPFLFATTAVAFAQTPAPKPPPAAGYDPIKFGPLTIDLQEKMRFEF